MKGTYGEFIATANDRGEKHSKIFSLTKYGVYLEGSSIREIAFYKSISHSNIPKCSSIKLTTKKVIIELERGDCTLHTYVHTNTMANRINQFNRIFIGVAHGLRFMHQQNIVHGDLKPANIVVRPLFATMLIDFGTVIFKHKNRYNRGLTTYNYVSPEESLRGINGTHNDMYALGKVMLFYFTRSYGKLFDSYESINDYFTSIKIIPIPSSIRSIPMYILKLIRRLLKYDHCKRPTADDVINILDPDGVYKSIGSNNQLKYINVDVQDVYIQDEDIQDVYIDILQKKAPNFAITNVVRSVCMEFIYSLFDPMNSDVRVDDLTFKLCRKHLTMSAIYIKWIIRSILEILDFNLWINIS